MRLRMTCFVAATETISAERQGAALPQSLGIVDSCSIPKCAG
jgi:hypothetical protein